MTKQLATICGKEGNIDLLIIDDVISTLSFDDDIMGTSVKCSNERNGRTMTKSDITRRTGPTVDGDLPIIDECIGLDDGLKH